MILEALLVDQMNHALLLTQLGGEIDWGFVIDTVYLPAEQLHELFFEEFEAPGRDGRRVARLGRLPELPQGRLKLRVEFVGVEAQATLIVEHVTRLDDDLAPEWPSGSGSYRVLIQGSPGMKCEFEFWDEHGDHAVGGVVLTATRLVNAIPAVCEAPAGLLSALDLPIITGRGLMSD